MNQGVTFMNMAANYLAMGLNKMALKFSKESISNLQKLLQKNEDPETAKLIAISYLNMCLIYRELGKGKLCSVNAVKGMQVLRKFGFEQENEIYHKLDRFVVSKPSGGFVERRSKSRKKSRSRDITNMAKVRKEKNENLRKKQGKKIDFDLSTGIRINKNNLMDYNTKIYYCCDDFSKECDKNRKDVIVFGKPLKQIRENISPYGDKLKNQPQTYNPNSVKIMPVNRGAQITLNDNNSVQDLENEGEAHEGHYRDDLLSESWDEEDQERDHHSEGEEEFKEAQGRLVMRLTHIVASSTQEAIRRNESHPMDPIDAFNSKDCEDDQQDDEDEHEEREEVGYNKSGVEVEDDRDEDQIDSNSMMSDDFEDPDALIDGYDHHMNKHYQHGLKPIEEKSEAHKDSQFEEPKIQVNEKSEEKEDSQEEAKREEEHQQKLRELEKERSTRNIEVIQPESEPEENFKNEEKSEQENLVVEEPPYEDNENSHNLSQQDVFHDLSRNSGNKSENSKSDGIPIFTLKQQTRHSHEQRMMTLATSRTKKHYNCSPKSKIG